MNHHNGILTSVRTVRPKMFRARISICTNLFRPESNRTRINKSINQINKMKIVHSKRQVQPDAEAY